MLFKASEIIGLKVLTFKNGENIGNVKDLVFDPKDNKIKALVLKSGGLFSSDQLIRFEDIKAIGKDDVLIDSMEQVKSRDEVSPRIAEILQNHQYLTQSKIVTETGIDLGKVTDIYFDEKTGEVIEFEVSENALADLQSGRKTVRMSDIITVGKDAMIVKGFLQQKMEMQNARSRGMDQRSQAVLQDIRSKVKSSTRKARKSLDQAKSEENIDKAKGELQRVYHDINASVSDYQQELNPKLADLQKKSKQMTGELGQQVSKVADMIKGKFTETKGSMIEQRKKDAVGKYLTKNILLPNDQILAKKGDLITNKIVDLAEKNGLLEQVLANYSKDRESF